MSCGNNLHQILTAANNYQSVRDKLPPGMDEQHVGCMVFLLPYMELDPQYKLFSFQPSLYAFYYQDPLNRPPTTSTPTIPPRPDGAPFYGAQGNFKVFQCPSSKAPEETVTALLSVNYGLAGADFRSGAPNPTHLFSSYPGGLILGRSNY